MVPVSRFSGEMNTSLGNSITNYVFIKMIMSRFNVTGNFFIEGDDGLICLQDPLNVAAVEQYAIENGFKLKIQQVARPGDAGFLSTYWDEEGIPFKYPLGKYLAGSAWMPTQHPMDRKTLLLARLSSMIEENPKNDLLIELHHALCKKWEQTCDTLYIYKPDDNYFREKLDLQNITYTREHGMLKYAMPRYVRKTGGKVFLMDKYHMNGEHYEQMIKLINEDPEQAYARLVELFSFYDRSSTYYDYMVVTK